jgi:hypothetical protein
MKKIFNQKNFNNFVGTPLDTGGKFAASVVDTDGNLPPVSLTLAANS